MFAAVVMALVLAGCGRIAFDPRADGRIDDASADAAAADAAPSCDPGAPFGTPVAVTELNDLGDNDGSLRLMPDELTGYFWRGSPGAQDIYLAQRPDLETPFSVIDIQAGLNTVANELDPSPSSDGTVLVFRRNGPGDDLFVAVRDAPDRFSGEMPLSVLNTTSSETQSFLPIGIDEIYYQSKQTGAGDLYVSVRTGTTFAAPVLLAELATASDEGDPVVTPDGLTIYFRSDRLATFAGFNVFTATRSTPTGTFGAASLVPNVNTESDDGPSWISRDGCRLYLSSRVDGTNDIFVATRGM